MPEYRRFRIPGGTYFFTVVTLNRIPLLTSDIARRCLRSAWIAVQRKHPFKVDAVCLLPDHLHCVWTLPEGDDDYSCRWKMIKGLFSMRYLSSAERMKNPNESRKRKGEASLWQRRFWEHWIQSEKDFSKHIDYIHFNPVKHDYVNQPALWPWSSFHRYCRSGVYDSNWGLIEPLSIKGYECGGE